MNEPNFVFTIVMPTFNRPEFLDRALVSIAKQTFHSYEVIVVDDHSAVPAVIPRDLGILNARVIRHDSNKGPAAAYNTGIAAASGSLISILDDDDEFEPTFLEVMSQAFAQHPDAEWAWCSVKVVQHSTDRSTSMPTTRRFPPVYETDDELFLDALSIGNGFGFTLRKECYERVGSYDESFRTAEDTEFIYRLLAASARPLVVPETLVTIHNHNEVRCTSAVHDPQRAVDCKRILERHSAFIRQRPRLRAQLERHIMQLCGGE